MLALDLLLLTFYKHYASKLAWANLRKTANKKS